MGSFGSKTIVADTHSRALCYSNFGVEAVHGYSFRPAFNVKRVTGLGTSPARMQQGLPIVPGLPAEVRVASGSVQGVSRVREVLARVFGGARRQIPKELEGKR